MPQEYSAIPQWQQDYLQKLQQRAESLGKESYRGFKYLSTQQKKELEKEIKGLEDLQKGTETAFIPFSITGSSKPIHLTPTELKRISSDEGFAAEVYKAVTGISKVTSEEINDLQARAEGRMEDQESFYQNLLKNKENELEQRYYEKYFLPLLNKSAAHEKEESPERTYGTEKRDPWAVVSENVRQYDPLLKRFVKPEEREFTKPS